MNQIHHEKPGPRGKTHTHERGFALLLATIIAVLLTLIGLSLTTSSMTEFQSMNEFEAHEKALMIADAGLNLAKEQLRGQILSDLLSAQTNVPKYTDYTDPEAGSFAARNPILPFEARNINFSDLPTAVGTRQVQAFLTSTVGSPISNGWRGRYFASLTDNADEALFGLLDDPLADMDYSVILRVVGVHPIDGSQGSGVGSARKNAVAILEAELQREMSFDLSSPMNFLGPNVDATFAGNAFNISGDDDHPAIGVMNDDPGTDGADGYASLLSAVGSFGTLIGKNGPDGIPIMDLTQTVRDDAEPGSDNLFDPDYLMRFASLIAAFADVLYETDQVLEGRNTVLGTVDDPQITVALGDLDLSGRGSGAGILVVKGNLIYEGAFDFDGVFLVLGEGNVTLSGANKTITGGLLIARIEDDGAGNYSVGVPTLSLSGNSDFVFSGDSIRLAVSLLPMKVTSMREITPELEP